MGNVKFLLDFSKNPRLSCPKAEPKHEGRRAPRMKEVDEKLGCADGDEHSLKQSMRIFSLPKMTSK